MDRRWIVLACGELMALGCVVTDVDGDAASEPNAADPNACEIDDEGDDTLRSGVLPPLADDFVDPIDPQPGAFEVGTAWPKRTLRVCFTTAGFGTEKGWIRAAVRDSWEAVSGVRFSGWTTCQDDKDGDISIALDDFGNGGSSELGTQSLLAHPSMRITVDYERAGCGQSTPCNELPDDNGKTGRQNCIEEVAKHEFGHALGLRHEHARPDSTCGDPSDPENEQLDETGLDGQELWWFDDASVMSYCHLGTVDNPILSQGDVHTINSLYAGPVRVFTEMDFQGESQAFAWGTWLDCDMKLVHGDEITSIVVPPGMRARVCTPDESHCQTFIQSTNLQAPLCNNVGRIEVDARLHLYGEAGFRGDSWLYLEPGTYAGGDWPFALIDDRAGAIVVPPGIAARVCSNADGSGTCLDQNGHDPMVHALPPALDQEASFAEVRPRVVTYTRAQYGDELFSYEHGVYRESDGSLVHPAAISAISIPTGLQARVCTDEGDGTGGGDCATIRRSQAELPPALDEQIRWMEIRDAEVTPMELICVGGID